MTKTVSNDDKKRRRLRIVRRFEIAFVVLMVVGLIAVGASCIGLKKTFDNGGYSEEWTDGVDGTTLHDVAYGERPWEVMNVYVPKTLDPSKVNGAILFIHGGAWVGGSRSEQQGFARYMAKEGWLTANMEYMLYNNKLSEDEKKDYSVFKVLDEIDMALAKLKEVGAERGYNVEKVALSGHSAGGHLTMLYGYTYKTRDGANPPVDVAFIVPRVGPSDFFSEKILPQDVQDVSDRKLKSGLDFLSFMSGVAVTPQDFRERRDFVEKTARSISPAAQVADAPVPTLAAFGGKDSLVPETVHGQALVQEFRKFDAKEIAAAPADVSDTLTFDYLVFPNSGHMLAEDVDYVQRWRDLFKTYADRYLGTVVDDGEKEEKE